MFEKEYVMSQGVAEREEMKMKRFWNEIMEWKNYIGLMFTGSICVYGVIALLLGKESLELSVVGQILLISVLGTLIQGIAFAEDWVIKHMAYTKRMLLFVALFLPMLSACAVVFHWFPTTRLISWFIFIGIFLVVFVIITLMFELHFRAAGRKYDGLLGQYKKKKGIE